jgi:hypothetical protein
LDIHPYSPFDSKNGYFNFMAAYEGKEFGNRFETWTSPNSFRPMAGKGDTSLANTAERIANTLIANRAQYESEDPSTGPYQWENWADKSFHGRDAQGNLIFP